MKKIICILSLFLLSILLFSCSKEESIKTTIVVPKGSPYLAIAGLLSESCVEIDSVAGPSNLQSALAKGDFDIVIAPINIAVNLYNSGNSKYQISHILTSNNAYIVTRSKNNLNNLGDLKGQKVLGFAANGIPGSILKTIYKSNELDINNVLFKYSSSADIYSVFAGKETEEKYALMSEPEITKMVLNDNISVNKLDLCKELGIDVAQACIFINPDSNKDAIKNVLKLIEDNVNFLNTNPSNYADKIIPLDRSFDAMGKEVIIESIPTTNIIFKEAKANKSIIENILTILNVELPNDAFYY